MEIVYFNRENKVTSPGKIVKRGRPLLQKTYMQSFSVNDPLFADIRLCYCGKQIL